MARQPFKDDILLQVRLIAMPQMSQRWSSLACQLFGQTSITYIQKFGPLDMLHCEQGTKKAVKAVSGSKFHSGDIS